MRVADMPVFSRPREKLFEKGVSGLTNAELLAILLRTGYQGKSAVEIAKRLLKTYSLQELMVLPISKFKSLKGIGASRAATIVAAFELGKRSMAISGKPTISSAEDVVVLLHDIAQKKREHLVALYLNARGELLQKHVVSIGTVTEGIVHPREVFAPAVKLHAVSVILGHNHPSGNPEPSLDDRAITKRLVEAGKLLGIVVSDHVVVTADGFCSFKKEGFM